MPTLSPTFLRHLHDFLVSLLDLHVHLLCRKSAHLLDFQICRLLQISFHLFMKCCLQRFPFLFASHARSHRGLPGGALASGAWYTSSNRHPQEQYPIIVAWVVTFSTFLYPSTGQLDCSTYQCRHHSIAQLCYAIATTPQPRYNTGVDSISCILIWKLCIENKQMPSAPVSSHQVQVPAHRTPETEYDLIVPVGAFFQPAHLQEFAAPHVY